MSLTTVRSPNRLVMPRTSMASSSGMNSMCELHVDRLPGMQFRGHRGVEDRFNHKDEFAAGLLAVDHGWGVFRARRNETHLPDESFADAVDADIHAVTGMDCSN